jgi:hypothetical protein
VGRNRGAIPVGVFCQAALGGTATCMPLPCAAVVIGVSVRGTVPGVTLRVQF